MGLTRALMIVAIVFSLVPAQAEYRVFQLVIQDSETGQARTVLSTLDDIQYPMYFHLKLGETIAIEDTWMCYQRSDSSQDPEQKFCARPPRAASAPIRPPASP